MRARTARHRRARGFSLIEFITSGALTLLLLAGVGAIFIGARTSYGKAEQLGQLQEHGRYALDLISRDLRMVEYPGCSHRAPFTATTRSAALSPPTALRAFKARAPTIDSALSSDIEQLALAGTDVLILSTASSPMPLRAAMQSNTDALQLSRNALRAVRAGDVMLASTCQARAMFTVVSTRDDTLEYEAAPVHASGQASQSLGYSFPAGTELMQIRTQAYFLRDDPTTGRPALWRRMDAQQPEKLVPGIADMQFLFGIDEDSDGVVDVDTSSDQITDWGKVRTVSITLLVIADGTERDASKDAGTDLRETFTATVTLRNRKVGP